jgi:hypothetical protein
MTQRYAHLSQLHKMRAVENLVQEHGHYMGTSPKGGNGQGGVGAAKP